MKHTTDDRTEVIFVDVVNGGKVSTWLLHEQVNMFLTAKAARTEIRTRIDGKICLIRNAEIAYKMETGLMVATFEICPLEDV